MLESQSSFTRFEQFYCFLLGIFGVVLLISNLITVKLIAVPYFSNYAVPCGVLIYPVLFLIGDLVTEIYGGRRARFMVYFGFLMCLFANGLIQLGLQLPPHTDWVSANNPYGYADSAGYELAFQSIFGLNGIALMSSMLAYAISQLLDIRVFLFIKEITKSRHLWLRNGGSTLTSQIIETLIANTLFLYCGLKLDLALVIKISIICYLYKLLALTFSVPLFYLFVLIAKRFLKLRTPPLESSENLPLTPKWSAG